MKDDMEAHLRRAHEAGDYEAVAREFLERQGPNIFRFVRTRFADSEDAREAFARFGEDFWRGLPAFQWRSSLRSWAFTLARNAAFQHARDMLYRKRHNGTLPSDSRLAAIAESVRKESERDPRSEVQRRLRELRNALAEEDQTLLILRVDQRLSWLELAAVLRGEDLSGDDRQREAARLRQQFKRIKQRLRSLAERQGLLARTRVLTKAAPEPTDERTPLR